MIELGKYLLVYFLATFRFFLGPVFGTINELGVIVSAVLTISGMMTTVYLISYFGPWIRKGYEYLFPPKNKRIFTPRKRRFVRIWRSYGLKGLAFATPIILSPIIGVILSNLYEPRRGLIIKWMWISAVFWAFFESILFRFTYDLVYRFV